MFISYFLFFLCYYHTPFLHLFKIIIDKHKKGIVKNLSNNYLKIISHFKKVVLGTLRDKREEKGFITFKELPILFGEKNDIAEIIECIRTVKLGSTVCKANINSEKEVKKVRVFSLRIKPI